MRWGSCTPEGKVFISWQNVMAPLNVFDYLLVHESPDYKSKIADKIL